ncbi:MAG: hydrogenase expression/formation protein HypE [Butyrivibrio sp.]|nr:hydrogenase expression/formation protein HypE [Butyrivibrio sp.]
MTDQRITMAHGSGGESTSELIAEVFGRYFHNEVLDRLGDAAVVQGAGRIALTTDSFVVTPVFFPGGDIGRLAVCGTVNDLLMSGATPQYLTCACIIEEGLPVEELIRVVSSMAETAKEAGVSIVTGDTKVVERRSEDRSELLINTAGVGMIPDDREAPLPEAARCQPGDVVIVSGVLGDHHAAILSARMGIQNAIVSDAAPLTEMVSGLMAAGMDIHAMRDVTRGGLGTILREFAESARCGIEIREEALPVRQEVRDFCGLLGLDPLYMGNEGKAVFVVAPEDAERALSIIRGSRYGAEAVCIGTVQEAAQPEVVLHTRIGGRRRVGPLIGEGLPRIC